MSFVREKPPTPHTSRPIGVTSHTTPLSNRRGVGGEASVKSVCRRPSVGSKHWWKSSVKSVWSVREKPPTPHTSRPIGGNLTYYPLSIRRGAGGEACPVGVTTHTTSLPAGEVLREVPVIERRGGHLLSLASPVLSRNLSLLPT